MSDPASVPIVIVPEPPVPVIDQAAQLSSSSPAPATAVQTTPVPAAELVETGMI